MEEPNLDAFKYYCSSFKSTFRIDGSKTYFSCPKCKRGRLVAEQHNFHYEVVEGKCEHSGDLEKYSYSGYFICDLCKAKVFSIGNGQKQYYQWGDEYGEFDTLVLDDFTPLFFSPTVMMFDIPEATPEPVVDCLMRAFALCWNDISASCNVLRVTVEILLKERWPEVPIIINGKYLNKKLNELKKIEASQPKLLEILDYFLAIKWLGNNGSHDDELEERDLAVAFKIMEKALILLYSQDDNSVSEWVRMINAAEGRPIKS